jgi:hypothetical protein
MIRKEACLLIVGLVLMAAGSVQAQCKDRQTLDYLSGGWNIAIDGRPEQKLEISLPLDELNRPFGRVGTLAGRDVYGQCIEDELFVVVSDRSTPSLPPRSVEDEVDVLRLQTIGDKRVVGTFRDGNSPNVRVGVWGYMDYSRPDSNRQLDVPRYDLPNTIASLQDQWMLWGGLKSDLASRLGLPAVPGLERVRGESEYSRPMNLSVNGDSLSSDIGSGQLTVHPDGTQEIQIWPSRLGGGEGVLRVYRHKGRPNVMTGFLSAPIRPGDYAANVEPILMYRMAEVVEVDRDGDAEAIGLPSRVVGSASVSDQSTGKTVTNYKKWLAGRQAAQGPQSAAGAFDYERWQSGGVPTVTTGRNPKDTCRDAIQGNIAWDYRGSTDWNFSNLNSLCDGAEESTEPAECFWRAMHGDAKAVGSPWDWSDASTLCRGTLNAENRIACFVESLAAGVSKSRAIRDCRYQ